MDFKFLPKNQAGNVGWPHMTLTASDKSGSLEQGGALVTRSLCSHLGLFVVEAIERLELLFHPEDILN